MDKLPGTFPTQFQKDTHKEGFSGCEVLYPHIYVFHQAFQLVMPIRLTRQPETVTLGEISLGAQKMRNGTEHLLHKHDSLVPK